jgi:hypothetical protein
MHAKFQSKESEGKRSLGRRRRRWKEKIITVLKHQDTRVLTWINLAEGRDK